MPGVWHTRSLAYEGRKYASSHHRHAATIRHSLRDGLRFMARSPRGAGLVSPRRLGIITQGLTPASGRQDHTLSPSAAGAFVSRTRSVHRIPLPTFVTIGRNAPLIGGGMRTDNHIFLKNGSEIFASIDSTDKSV